MAGVVAEAASDLIDAFSERIKKLESMVSGQEEEVKSQEATLREKLDAQPDDELAASKREMAKNRYDASARKRSEYEAILDDLQDELSERDRLVESLEDAQLRLTGARSTSQSRLVKRLNEFQSDSLEISVRFQGGADRKNLVSYLRDGDFLNVQYFGQYKRSKYGERCASMAPPTSIARYILTGDIQHLEQDREIGDSDALSDDDAKKLFEAYHPYDSDDDANVRVTDRDRLDAVMRLQEVEWDDEVRILLNERPVDKLSPGQRSSAMLPLVALSERVPLVIDQPEDNLDNRMVGSTLVKILADLKEHRQIIVATHNPNIVVSGDAENVIVLDPRGADNAVVEDTGSIDADPIVDAVIGIMEGGKEAFRVRERRYENRLAVMD